MREKRTYKIELRAEPDSRMVEGYAALYDSLSKDLGGFQERLSPGAFGDTDMSETVALFNHDYNFPLASRNNNSLEITHDDKGIRYRFEMPNTSYGNDLLELMRSGIVSQSSFAFTVNYDDTEWEKREDGTHVRHIKKIKKLYDVSPVTSPAYADTTAAVRSFEQYKEETKPQPTADWLDYYLKTLEYDN